MSSRPNRVFGYARVSSEQQARGTSLADQQESIRAYAESRGLKVDRFFVEAESAVHEKYESREQIQRLLREARSGDLIVCDKLDRWSRDPAFTHTSVRDLLKMGASFYAVSDRCDPSTSEGDTALGFRVLFAREEHKRIRERTVGTRNLLRDQGYYVEGVPPTGYRRSLPKGTKGVEKNVLVLVDEDAARVRRIFALCIEGQSVERIASATGIQKKTVHHILQRRYYTGEIDNSRGEWIRGKHPPIIDVETFARAQEALRRRRLGGSRPRRDSEAETFTWIMRDVARCGHCGAKMTAAYAGPRGPMRRFYYRCYAKCRARGARVTTGAHVAVGLVEALFSVQVIERLAELREELAKTPSERTIEREPDYAERLERIAKKRARHLDAHADFLTTRDELRAALEKLEAERQRIEAEQHEARARGRLHEPEVRHTVFREVTAIRDAWSRTTPEERREIVNRLTLSVAVASGQPPGPVWRTADELAATFTL